MAEIDDENNDIETNDCIDGEFFICSGCTTAHDDPNSNQEEKYIVSSVNSTSIVDEIQKAITDENITTTACEVDNSAISEHSGDINITTTACEVNNSAKSEHSEDINITTTACEVDNSAISEHSGDINITTTASEVDNSAISEHSEDINITTTASEVDNSVISQHSEDINITTTACEVDNSVTSEHSEDINITTTACEFDNSAISEHSEDINITTTAASEVDNSAISEHSEDINITTSACGVDNSAISEHSDDRNITTTACGVDNSAISEHSNDRNITTTTCEVNNSVISEHSEDINITTTAREVDNSAISEHSEDIHLTTTGCGVDNSAISEHSEDINITTTAACGVDNSAISEQSEDTNTTLKVKGYDTLEIQQNKNVGYQYDILNEPLCILCSYRNKNSIATRYCEQCMGNLCEICSSVHKRRIATQQHKIIELKLPETIQTVNKDCTPCQYRNQTSAASWHCKDCQETLCEICCTEHRKLTATSNHILVSLPESKVVGTTETECYVCNMDGTSTMASVSCEKCDENLCEKCSLDHKRRKATKNHNLLELQKKEPKHGYCDVCKSRGEDQIALHYCGDCSEKLCQLCFNQHKTRKATTKHILLDLELCHLKSNEVETDVHLCDPCEQIKQYSFASSFCESCREFLCVSCVNHHKKMKATSSHIHVVNDFQDEGGLSNQSYTCDPCSTESKSVNAHFYCRVCEEYFCTPCSKQHRLFRATKDHKQVNLKEETACLLLQKSDCDICKMDGIEKTAYLFCDMCNETYCSPCAKIHSSQKATRQHELVDVAKRKSVSTSQDDTKNETSHASTVPGKPIMEDVTTNSIRIRWTGPNCSTKHPTHYDIRYKAEVEEKWRVHSTDSCSELDTITGLKCHTEYRFKIRAVYIDTESEDSQVSEVIKTTLSLGRKIKEYSLPLCHNTGAPDVYKVPIIEEMKCRNEKAKTRRVVFGQHQPGKQEKTIMVVGASGAGKSTLIEGMINYIFGVSWEDDFRFSIIDLMEEEKQKNNDQTISQTEWITCYTLNWLSDFQIDYTLNIIDTPGFGDTRGIERDQEVVEQIRELFTLTGDQGIDTIDGICFITQAPLARLTAPQKYIIDSILSIFGRDIMENIFGLITFADGKTPPVLEALKTADVPIIQTFVFNNSALFEQNKDTSNSFSPMFWNMGKQSFASFFRYLTSTQSVSLQLTSEVLQERKQLQILVEGLRPQINEGMTRIETLRQETEILKKHECDIRENKNFTYSIIKPGQRKVDLEPGIHVTNCLVCNRTCHDNCHIADDNKKYKCSSIKKGFCKVCPKHCSWQEHKNNPYKLEFYTEVVQSTYKELQAKYKTAQSGVLKQQEIVAQIRQQVKSNEAHVQGMIEEMRISINRISAIALKPNPLSNVQYIDLLIDAEKQEAKCDFRSRIKTLKKFREDAILMQKVPDHDYKPFGDITEYMGEPEKPDSNPKGIKQKIRNFFK